MREGRSPGDETTFEVEYLGIVEATVAHQGTGADAAATGATVNENVALGIEGLYAIPKVLRKEVDVERALNVAAGKFAGRTDIHHQWRSPRPDALVEIAGGQIVELGF